VYKVYLGRYNLLPNLQLRATAAAFLKTRHCIPSRGSIITVSVVEVMPVSTGVIVG
jgi:hypothetical protein